jgi:two-component system, cell cycle response regulator DivK
MSQQDSKGTILYIEDNADNRTLVRRILNAEDYEFAEATNAHDALVLLETTRPNLILMDINMPDMDGYALTAKIKSMPGFARIPILAITANVMRGDREKSLEAGCDGYIQKPLDVDQLVNEIEKFLARSPNV